MKSCRKVQVHFISMKKRGLCPILQLEKLSEWQIGQEIWYDRNKKETFWCTMLIYYIKPQRNTFEICSKNMEQFKWGEYLCRAPYTLNSPLFSGLSVLKLQINLVVAIALAQFQQWTMESDTNIDSSFNHSCVAIFLCSWSWSLPQRDVWDCATWIKFQFL